MIIGIGINQYFAYTEKRTECEHSTLRLMVSAFVTKRRLRNLRYSTSALPIATSYKFFFVLVLSKLPEYGRMLGELYS